MPASLYDYLVTRGLADLARQCTPEEVEWGSRLGRCWTRCRCRRRRRSGKARRRGWGGSPILGL